MKSSTLSLLVSALLCLACLLPREAAAQYFASRFPQQTGAELYQNICQGCHMPDAKGATGAGTYPALAANKHLRAGLYPVGIVLNGHKAMPAFGEMLTDAQIAAVVNYIRTHFGNQYKDAVSPEMVKVLRPK